MQAPTRAHRFEVFTLRRTKNRRIITISICKSTYLTVQNILIFFISQTKLLIIILPWLCVALIMPSMVYGDYHCECNDNIYVWLIKIYVWQMVFMLTISNVFSRRSTACTDAKILLVHMFDLRYKFCVP